jgi:hypothetical protein
MMTKLALHMRDAWLARADEALDVLRVFLVAPALVKPSRLDEARREYAHALIEADRWER